MIICHIDAKQSLWLPAWITSERHLVITSHPNPKPTSSDPHPVEVPTPNLIRRSRPLWWSGFPLIWFVADGPFIDKATLGQFIYIVDTRRPLASHTSPFLEILCRIFIDHSHYRTGSMMSVGGNPSGGIKDRAGRHSRARLHIWTSMDDSSHDQSGWLRKEGLSID